GPAAGDGSGGRERIAGGRLVRRRPARGVLQGATARRGLGQVDHARQLVGQWRRRADAFLVSRDDQDRPFYGGTPSDFAVVQAIQEMKARGLRVTFYPFILMDVPPGNTLPNPYSNNAAEAGQPAFPWRGRITCSPA